MPKLQTLTLEIVQSITSSRSNALEKLATQLTNLRNAVDGLGNLGTAAASLRGLGDAINSLGNSGAQLDTLARGLQAIGGAARSTTDATASIRGLVGVFGEMNAALAGIDLTSIEEIGTALALLSESSRDIGTAAAGLGQFASGLARLTQFAQDGIGVQRMLRMIDDIIERLVAHAPELAAFSSTLTDVANALRTIGNAGDFNTHVEHVSRSMHSASKSSHTFAKNLLKMPWKLAAAGVDSLTGRFGRLFSSIKRIAFYRAIRALLKHITQGFSEGVKHLYQWSQLTGNDFKNSMDSLATSAHYLRDSFGAMASPLIDSLAPAIEAIVDKFVNLLNIVNQFFAVLTGKSTWRKAVRTSTTYSGAMKEAADSTKQATKAQKELNKALQGFDELNLITTSEINARKPSGGSGTTDGVTAGEFTEEQVNLPSWLQQVIDLSKDDKWYQAGQTIGNKLNELVRSWNAYGDGLTVGQKIENTLELLNGFLESFSFYDLGSKLALWVNGLTEGINPDSVSDFFDNLFNDAMDVIYGFQNNLKAVNLAADFATIINKLTSADNMNKLALNISKFVNNIFEFMKYAIEGGDYKYIDEEGNEIVKHFEGIKFKEIGENLGKAIGTAFRKIDWKTVGTVISDIATGIVNFIKGAIKSLIENSGDIKKAFGNLFSGLWGEDGEGMKNIVTLTGWILGFKYLFGTAFKTGASEALAAGGAVEKAVSGYMDSFAARLGVISLVIGFTYFISESGGWEEPTPESIGEHLDNGPAAKLGGLIDKWLGTGYTDEFIKGFKNALKNDSDVMGAAQHELDQIATKYVGDQGAANAGALEAALKAYEQKLKNAGYYGGAAGVEAFLNGSGTYSGGPAGVAADEYSWYDGGSAGVSDYFNLSEEYNGGPAGVANDQLDWTTDQLNSLGRVKQAADEASAAVQNVVPSSGTVETFKTQTKTMSDKLTGKTGSLLVAANTAHDKGIAHIAPDSDDTTAFNNALKPWKKKLNGTGKNDGSLTQATDAVKKKLEAVANGTYNPKITVTTTGVTEAQNSINALAKDKTSKIKYVVSFVESSVNKSGKTIETKLSMKEIQAVRGLASGGWPDQGSLFVAGEAGPEFVSKINGRTGVASGQEVTGIADAVYNTGETEAELLRQQNQLLRQLLQKSGSVTLAPTAAAGKWVAQSQAAYARATGG